MQDFSLTRLSSDVCAWPHLLPLSDEDIKEMETNPQAMYHYALRAHRRLPDRLHEAMLLHSFNPEHRQDVQMYMLWVSHCEEMHSRMESYKKSESFRDRVIMGSMIMVAVAYVTLALAMVL